MIRGWRFYNGSMDIVNSIAVAAGLAWASGLRLYAVLFLAGLLGRLGYVSLPEALTILQHPAVIGAAGLMFFVEFFADKIPGLDSVWDGIHTFIRIPAGALLAAYSLAGQDPATVQGKVVTDRRYGAKSRSAYRRHLMIGVMAPVPDRHKGARL